MNRCDLLILLDGDLCLFPVAGPFVEKNAPWYLDEVTRLRRPLSTIGGKPIHVIVALSVAARSENKIATTFG